MKLIEAEVREFEKYTSLFDFSDNLKKKTVLVTGARGIIGGGIVRWLLFENMKRKNETRVIASTRTPQKKPDYIEESDNIVFCKFGEEGLVDEKIDYIIHAASPTSNKAFTQEPVESFSAILDGTRSVLELAKSQKDCSVVFLSSEEVYGTGVVDAPVKEEYVGAIDSLRIRNCYPIAKKAAELLCRAYCEEYGLRVMILRPTVIMGLFQPYDSVKIEAEVLRCIVESKDLQLKTNGMTKKSILYSMDALSAVLTVLFKGKPGEAYNATNPDTFQSVRDMASAAFEMFNPAVRVRFLSNDEGTKSGYLPQRAIQEDITKICELGWKPFATTEYIYKGEIERFSR